MNWKDYIVADPEDPGRYLAEFLTGIEIDFSYTLTVIDEDTIRQRRYKATE